MLPSGFGVIFCMRVLTKSNGRLHALAKKPIGDKGKQQQQQQQWYVSKTSHSSMADACRQHAGQKQDTTKVCSTSLTAGLSVSP
jgi:hypothetical protein